MELQVQHPNPGTPDKRDSPAARRWPSYFQPAAPPNHSPASGSKQPNGMPLWFAARGESAENPTSALSVVKMDDLHRRDRDGSDGKGVW